MQGAQAGTNGQGHPQEQAGKAAGSLRGAEDTGSRGLGLQVPAAAKGLVILFLRLPRDTPSPDWLLLDPRPERGLVHPSSPTVLREPPWPHAGGRGCPTSGSSSEQSPDGATPRPLGPGRGLHPPQWQARSWDQGPDQVGPGSFIEPSLAGEVSQPPAVLQAPQRGSGVGPVAGDLRAGLRGGLQRGLGWAGDGQLGVRAAAVGLRRGLLLLLTAGLGGLGGRVPGPL